MHNPTQYRRLTGSEREEVSRGLARGETLSAVARRLGRTPSAIAREVNRNSGVSGYRVFSAGRRAMERASSRRNGKSRMTREERLRISHEAIYRYIYVLPRGSLKQMLIRALRQERTYRRKHRRGNVEETRGKIADMLSIEERPREVVDRSVP